MKVAQKMKLDEYFFYIAHTHSLETQFQLLTFTKMERKIFLILKQFVVSKSCNEKKSFLFKDARVQLKEKLTKR
jgi:hypothetical protein